MCQMETQQELNKIHSYAAFMQNFMIVKAIMKVLKQINISRKSSAQFFISLFM